MHVDVLRAGDHARVASGVVCPLCLRLRDARDMDTVDLGQDEPGVPVCTHCVDDHAEWAAGRAGDEPEPWEFADAPAENDVDAAE